MKTAQLDPISWPCFPFQFAYDLALTSMLPQAGKEPGTTSCWVIQLRDQETHITRQSLCVCTLGSSSRVRKERSEAEARKTSWLWSFVCSPLLPSHVVLGALGLSVPQDTMRGTQCGRIPRGYRSRLKRTTAWNLSFNSVWHNSPAVCSPGPGEC